MPSTTDAALKFDPARAGEYETQSRIALAGYEACHELTACILATALGSATAKHLLIVGAGGGAPEVLTASALEPKWRFTAVDPSEPMLAITRAKLEQHALLDRTQIHHGYIDDLPAEQCFDAATLIGVLHHLKGEEAKRAMLRAIAARLKPVAPLVLAGNRGIYASNPLFLTAWGERWRMKGASSDEVKAKLDTILRGADAPQSDEAVGGLLREAGFEPPVLFFSSLFWGAWLARRTESLLS